MKLTRLFTVALLGGAGMLLMRNADALKQRLGETIGLDTVSGGRESGFETRSAFNSTELEPTETARKQHVQPMERSEEIVDDAHTAHGR